ncbi:MAG TPA: TIGR03790 family protein [Tepidisphaeraceae bacterium]|nr:TIGR03790 family protein [Tepidisphaeraceae bacterium]
MSGRALGNNLFVCFAALTIGASWCYALDAKGVLVLYNNASEEGRQIADYYATVHPGVRLLGLSNVPTSDEVTVGTYLQIIRPQVRAALDDSVDVIVTTKGLPVRIYNPYTPASFPYNYTDSSGQQHTIYADTYKRYSSLESELTRVDTFGTWKQLGDQTWWYPPAGSNPTANPYFRRDASFSHTDPLNESMRLSARLDGFSAADVIAGIRRAQLAYVVPSYQQVVIDDSPIAAAHEVTSMSSLAGILAERGQDYIYDDTTDPVLTAPRPVVGYVSHGVNDGPGGLELGYPTQQLQFHLANGAIFHTWESYNGVTFDETRTTGQGLIAGWLRAGGTAGIAHVEEPGGSLYSVTNEDRLFEMMLEGYSFVEAAWNATPQLSFVNTVVGDPLMVWKNPLRGDANLDGVVTIADIIDLSGNFGIPDATWRQGDFNGDGLVTISDLIDAITNYGRSDLTLLSGLISPASAASSVAAVPEPAGLGMIGFGAMTLLRRWRRQTAAP